jgi:hypothetical protein
MLLSSSRGYARNWSRTSFQFEQIHEIIFAQFEPRRPRTALSAALPRFRGAILGGRARPGSGPATRAVANYHFSQLGGWIIAIVLGGGYAVARVGSGTYVASELPGPERSAASALRSAPVASAPPRLSRAGRRLVARGASWTATKPGLR